MRQWLVVLLATLAVVGIALPVLASEPAPVITLPGDLGVGNRDALPSNGNGVDNDEGAVNDNDDGDVDDDQDDVDDVDDGDVDDDEDDFEDGEREVKVELDEEENEVLIKLEAKDGAREDEVKVQFEANEGQMKVSFETEASLEEEVEMRIVFRKLVEFEDADANGAFSPLNDEVLQSFEVETLPVLVLQEGPFVHDTTTGRRISVVYGLPGATGGTFELVFWVFGLVTEIDGVPVRPTETKIDILVTDFPFVSTTSRLALGLEVKTEFELEDPGVTFGQITVSGADFAAFFQWMPDAVTVEGDPASATVTTVRERQEIEVEGGEGEFEEVRRLFLAYPQGDAIWHDPKVGILAVAVIPPVLPALPSLAAYAVGLGTALLLVLGVWALNRRRP